LVSVVFGFGGLEGDDVVEVASPEQPGKESAFGVGGRTMIIGRRGGPGAENAPGQRYGTNCSANRFECRCAS
jgi:hypothetical protein